MSVIAASPAISDIKVTEFDASAAGQGIRIEWLDSAGARLSVTRFGVTARRLVTDLHAATLIGEEARRCFLIGFIRGLADAGGLDT